MKPTRLIPLLLLAYLTFGCATSGDTKQIRNPPHSAESGSGQGQRHPKSGGQTGSAAITWYSGGEGRLTLKPVSLDGSSTLLLAGSTTGKTLVVKVAKKGGAARSNPVPLAADGSFSVRYLLKDGTGTYTVTLFGSGQKGALNYEGLAFFSHTVREKLSADLLRLELNSRVIEYVNRVMGSRVGRGECWDLAQEALDMNLADWTRPTKFGIPLNPETDAIKAGDIIQFRSLKITEQLPGGVTRRESLGEPDHTAVIFKVLGKKRYTLAHQNVGGRRSVMNSDINLAKVTGGQYWIYRPVALMIGQ